MTKLEFENLVLQAYACTPDRPFSDDQDVLVFRHADNRKWFGIVMNIPKSKLGLADPGRIDIVNLKCPEQVLYTIRQEPGVFPAYHMNKAHWVSVALDGSATDDTIRFLCEQSFRLTASKKHRQN
jgi:predicted DNA-binding protein (MmcQ/YjbR family)